MKKILFITPQFPYPLDNGGKIGAFNSLDSLADNEVHLLAFSEQMSEVQKGKEIFSSRWPKLVFEGVFKQDIHIKHKPLTLFKRIIQSYFGKFPYMVVKFNNQEMFKRIDEIFQKYYFDVVFIDYLNMYHYGEYIKKKYSHRFALFVLKNHNIESEIVKQMITHAHFVAKLLLTPIWKKTKSYEESSIRNTDIILSVCDENTNFFKAFNHNAYTMLPTFDIAERRHNLPNNHQILYIGNLSWKANLEGVKWFVNSVLPILKEKYPDVLLTVAGSGKVENPFLGYSEIRWLGFVEDLSELYTASRVFIVPLFEGSGIRIKILEAFNHDIPVVSTPIGCQTIGVSNEKELLIADTKEEFAASIERLFDEDKMPDLLIQNAKQYLAKYFSIQARRSEMNNILNISSVSINTVT